MPEPQSKQVTDLLHRWRDGESKALDSLMPLVYDELRRIARRHMSSERRDHTLQPTALVHEAFGRLIDADVSWTDRVHFFAIAASTMRRILVEHARRAKRAKRGGSSAKVPLQEGQAVAQPATTDVLALNEALDKLGAFDARKARAVELFYFGGMTYDEGAAAIQISPATFHRELRLARAWLQRELSGQQADSDAH